MAGSQHVKGALTGAARPVKHPFLAQFFSIPQFLWPLLGVNGLKRALNGCQFTSLVGRQRNSIEAKHVSYYDTSKLQAVAAISFVLKYPQYCACIRAAPCAS